MWGVSDCTAGSKINQHMHEMVGEPARLQLWWEGVGDSSCTVDGEHRRSPSLFL